MIIGYARVSTSSQSLDRQLVALEKACADLVFEEKASGRSMSGRPELEKAISSLCDGDVFLIAEWDRATRSMLDGIKIIQRVADRGASVKVLDKDWLDLTTSVGKGILAFLSALAEDERERILQRANEGRAVARRKGVKFGRKPKLTAHQRRIAFERLEAGESARQIAKDFAVSHTTISRMRT